MTSRLRALTFVILTSFILAGCYRSNIPIDTAFQPLPRQPDTLKLFVDHDGTFYPNDWRKCLGNAPRSRHLSLLRRTAPTRQGDGECRGDDYRAALDQASHDLLTGGGIIDDFVRHKSRIFIFIHGYNNSQAEAEEAYRLLARSIIFDLSKDALIEFFWDGYTAEGRFNPSPAGFWFGAVKASQLAGQHGLRPVLEKLRDKPQVVVITHSRGASVLLSALSNPPYSSRFVLAWRKDPILNQRSLFPPPLTEASRKNIDAVFLAPAIGHLDFCKSILERMPPPTDKELNTDDYCKQDRESLRDLPNLRRMFYTVNEGDTTLKKKFGNLSLKYYPTSLGYRAATGRTLKGDYMGRLEMDGVPVEPPYDHLHGFGCYASDTRLAELLARVGVGWRVSNLPTLTQRKTCFSSAKWRSLKDALKTGPAAAR